MRGPGLNARVVERVKYREKVIYLVKFYIPQGHLMN